MTSNYNYTINKESIRIDQLHNEISESNITSPFLGINQAGNEITILFKSTLSTNDKTILDNLITSHVPTKNIGSMVHNISIEQNNINSSIYTTIGTIIYPGKSQWQNITNIGGISYMSADGTSYYLRIYDTTNNTVIAVKNFTNTDIVINDFGDLSNISNKMAIWEIQCKVVGSTTVDVKNIHIYYD